LFPQASYHGKHPHTLIRSEVPPSGIKYFFVGLLKALSYPFPPNIAPAGMGFVTNQPFFSPYFFSHSPTNYRFVLIVVDILVLVFIFLIFDFCS